MHRLRWLGEQGIWVVLGLSLPFLPIQLIRTTQSPPPCIPGLQSALRGVGSAPGSRSKVVVGQGIG